MSSGRCVIKTPPITLQNRNDKTTRTVNATANHNSPRHHPQHSHKPHKTPSLDDHHITEMPSPNPNLLYITPPQLKTITSVFRQELANSQEKNLEESGNKNQNVVLDLYEALKSRDVGTVHKILAPDLEWWFHGPPTHQFMMHLLTGSKSSQHNSFVFVPLSITSFGSIVIAEGCDHSRQISWVHAWTVTDGIITQVREYFNTSLTVTRFGKDLSGQSQSKKRPPSDFPSTVEINPVHCPSVWESSFSNRVGKSVPGLVLAL